MAIWFIRAGSHGEYEQKSPPRCRTSKLRRPQQISKSLYSKKGK
jgi:hypothetical protein